MPAAGGKIVISESRIAFSLRISSILETQNAKNFRLRQLPIPSGPGSGPDDHIRAGPRPDYHIRPNTISGPKIPKIPYPARICPDMVLPYPAFTLVDGKTKLIDT